MDAVGVENNNRHYKNSGDIAMWSLLAAGATGIATLVAGEIFLSKHLISSISIHSLTHNGWGISLLTGASIGGSLFAVTLISTSIHLQQGHKLRKWHYQRA